jgi:hypothetical protein
MKKKLLIFCGVLLVVGLSYMLYMRNYYNVVSSEEIVAVREKLKILSPQERQDLAFFVDEILFSQYSYTLVGYKPMSISVITIQETEDLQPWMRESFKSPRSQTLRQGYLVWEKCQSLFPLKKHILINYSFMGKGRREIVLICPTLCKTTIQEHLDDFQEILGKGCTSEEVFEILTHPEHEDFYTIVNHNRLFGILLGFGRNNAYLYEHNRGGASRSDVGHLRSLPDPLQAFSKEWPWLEARRAPNFACDPSTEETQQLKKHYQKARTIVRWTYFFRNDLEVTLALMAKN